MSIEQEISESMKIEEFLWIQRLEEKMELCLAENDKNQDISIKKSLIFYKMVS